MSEKGPLRRALLRGAEVDCATASVAPVGGLIVNVLPYGLAAAAAAPIVAVVSAVILAESKRPILSAWVFTAGAAALDIVYTVAILAAAEASGAFDGGSDAGAIVDLALGAIFLVLGVSAVLTHPDPEKEEAQQKRIRRAAAAGLGGMLVTGVIAQLINVDALAVYTGALKEVAESSVSTGEGAVAVLVALAVMLLPYYLPVVIFAVSPERSGRALARMSDWLLGHSRMLEIVVGLGFGAIFLVKGAVAI
jgi:threonine/homoserine/homoserine lactone efflux protein